MRNVFFISLFERFFLQNVSQVGTFEADLERRHEANVDFVFDGFVEVCNFSHDFDVCEGAFRQRINLWQPPLNQQVWFATVDNQHLEILAFAKVVGFLLRLRLPLVAKRALELGVHVFENFEVIHFEAKQVFQIRQQLRKLLGTLTEVQVFKEAAWRLPF